MATALKTALSKGGGVGRLCTEVFISGLIIKLIRNKVNVNQKDSNLRTYCKEMTN